MTHGLSRRNGKTTPTYLAWANARNRCTRPNDPSYPNYGGRGIEHRFDSVADLVADIGERPSPELTLDRIDNDGHYEAGNVRWATRSEQSRNQRQRRPVSEQTRAKLRASRVGKRPGLGRKQTDDEIANRSAALRAAHVGHTPAGYAEIGRKGWETRRRNQQFSS
jgi:hypothetical protein